MTTPTLIAVPPSRSSVVKLPHLRAEPVSSPPAPAKSAYPVTVLLIDDQIIISEAVRRILAAETDIAFHYCSDPTQAIQQAMTLNPSVILQDLVMPDIDGLMLLRWFRNNPVTQDVPMIVLSTKDDPNLKAEAFAQGANDYLIKLPDPIELIARIRYHSQAYNNLKALTTATKAAQQQAQTLERTLQELQTTQAQLIQAEKMSTIGQMVAGVAHEINNPVNFIYGNLKHVDECVEGLMELVQIYQQEYPEPTAVIAEKVDEIDLEFITDDLPKMLASMRIGADRIRDIVLSLRNFSRLDEAEKKKVNIHEGIDSTLLILNHRIKQHIEIIKRYESLPPVECYPAQLNQVFMNILNNAIDALMEMPDTTARCIKLHTELVGDDRVRIRIQDNGTGMPPEVQSQLFTPFFTTKPINQGTGLGLPICYQIMQKHQGTIMVSSEPGSGSEFCLELPIRQTSPDPDTL
ncbi:ATP-binding protein [Pantanalinema rosaneae CENA516]